ncbi:hypothetical protein BGX27_002140, partial [Mortierella sp. AM989]
LKDSDTTWLYGPLYKAAIDHFDMSRFGAQTQSGKAVSTPTTPTKEIPDGPLGKVLKPVLKRKTASELFKADTLFHVQSDLKLVRKIKPNSKAIESAVFKEYKQPKLRFNDSVEQCISVDSDFISEEDDNHLAENIRRRQHMSEDDGLLMRISAKRPIRSIIRIDPTKLKAANFHGMKHEIIVETVHEELVDEEELFEPIYLGNSYTDSEPGYVQIRQHVSPPSSEADYVDYSKETATAEISYTRPLPPSPPSESSNASALTSNMFIVRAQLRQEATKKAAANVGYHQRAVELVTNVRDLVSWASSFVYNSNTF